MNTFLIICGFMFAHAVWSISDGSILTPIGVTANSENDKQIKRFVDEAHYENSVAMAKEFLEKSSQSNKYVAVYFDGYYKFNDGEKVDALFMIARINDNGKTGEITMVLPYQKKKLFKNFKVYKPKLIGFSNITEEEITEKYKYFWQGIDKHEKGGKIWNNALDQSR